MAVLGALGAGNSIRARPWRAGDAPVAFKIKAALSGPLVLFTNSLMSSEHLRDVLNGFVSSEEFTLWAVLYACLQTEA
jgi:hypothetical protein